MQEKDTNPPNKMATTLQYHPWWSDSTHLPMAKWTAEVVVVNGRTWRRPFAWIVVRWSHERIRSCWCPPLMWWRSGWGFAGLGVWADVGWWDVKISNLLQFLSWKNSISQFIDAGDGDVWWWWWWWWWWWYINLVKFHRDRKHDLTWKMLV